MLGKIVVVISFDMDWLGDGFVVFWVGVVGDVEGVIRVLLCGGVGVIVLVVVMCMESFMFFFVL